MTVIQSPIEDSDLSVLPTSKPAGAALLPWRVAVGAGWSIVAGDANFAAAFLATTGGTVLRDVFTPDNTNAVLKVQQKSVAAFPYTILDIDHWSTSGGNQGGSIVRFTNNGTTRAAITSDSLDSTVATDEYLTIAAVGATSKIRHRIGSTDILVIDAAGAYVGGTAISLVGHTHAIASVTGLQTALDGKQASLGYTPVNKAGDTGIGASSFSGAITLSGTNNLVLGSTANASLGVSANTTSGIVVLTGTSAGADQAACVRITTPKYSRSVNINNDGTVAFPNWTSMASLYLGNNGTAPYPTLTWGAAFDTGPWLVSTTAGSRAYAISTDGAEAVRFGGSDTNRAATFYNGSFIQTTTSPSGGGVTLLQIGNSSYNMMLGTGSNGKVQINNGGTVSNPVRALNVYDDASTVYQIRMGHGNSFYWEMGRDNAGASADFLLGNGSVKFRIAPAGVATFSAAVVLGSYTVATLPSASANTRARAFATDSSLAFTSANLGSTVTAGGSNLVPVWSNGTNWVIG